jgi:tetratricopeptide (TPR) repeat protein
LASKEQFPAFDFAKHKLLCYELKNLYVAVTRAKMNLWMFDENAGARKPFLDILRSKGFIRMVGIDDETMKPLATKSSAESWVKRGHQFFERKAYATARRCFAQAGDEYNEKLAQAMELSEIAEEMAARKQLKEAKLKWREVADIFVTIDKKSAAAQLYWKAGFFKNAFSVFVEIGKFNEAIKCAFKSKLYDEAFNLVKMHAAEIHNVDTVCWDLSRYYNSKKQKTEVL